MLKKTVKIILIVLGSLILTAVCRYAVIAAHYNNKFLCGTVVNGRDLKGMTREAANEYLVNTYLPGVDYSRLSLLLEGRDGYMETLKGSEFDLRADMTGDLNKIMESQKPYEWFLYMLYPSEYTATPAVSYDRNLLADRLTGLECVGDKSMDPSL